MKLLYIDLFCGAGGTSTGVENARYMGEQCANRDADSRTLAEHLFRYIEAINPDYIQIENVDEFMVLYGIIDIKMRMLRIYELKLIMGFPSDYIIVGTQADQKKVIGNAVEVNMARVLCEAICKEIVRKRKVA